MKIYIGKEKQAVLTLPVKSHFLTNVGRDFYVSEAKPRVLIGAPFMTTDVKYITLRFCVFAHDSNESEKRLSQEIPVIMSLLSAFKKIHFFFLMLGPILFPALSLC